MATASIKHVIAGARAEVARPLITASHFAPR